MDMDSSFLQRLSRRYETITVQETGDLETVRSFVVMLEIENTI